MNTSLALVRVDLGERSYDIQIAPGWLAEFGPAMSALLPGHRFAVVTNEVIAGIWGGRVLKCLAEAGLNAELLALPEGEEAKTQATVGLIYDFLIQRKYDRQTCIVALGGGVVGDVAGFASACFLRGVPLVQVPTSLLAMVDSSIGGKTGVNHPLGKNLIGAFKQPALVGIDPDLLGTLPPEEFRSGLAEVVKYGMIADESFFDYLEIHQQEVINRRPEVLAHVITRSCQIKADVVMEDETETGLRAILNFGHTFAHAAETLTGYGTVRHGEAVAMGMVAACRLGTGLGVFEERLMHRLAALLRGLGLPVRLPRFDVDRYLDVMRSDKKVKLGRMRFIVPLEIGRVELRGDVEESAVAAALLASFA